MQLSVQGIAIIEQLINTLKQMKGEASIRYFIMPSIDILNTSISRNSKDKIKSSLVALGVSDGEYAAVVESYKTMQIENYFTCIDAIVNCLQILVDNKQASDIYFNKLLDFVEFEQISILTPTLTYNAGDKLNVAVKYRLVYGLVEHIYAALCQFRGGVNIIATNSYDHALLKKIDKATEEAVQNQEKRPHIQLLFSSELQIREASIIITGELVRNDHLYDIFLVYKSAAFGLTQMHKNDGSISYYNLAVKTLTQLAKASSLMQSHHHGQQLSVVIQPINQETAVGHHGLVRRSVFGVSISYQDTQSLALDITASPGFNHVYQLEPRYKLEPDLKMAYLAHIKILTKQLSESTSHPHKQRRKEKLQALEYIINADNHSELSPATIDEAKAGKNLLYLARGESVTQQLIEYAENSIKAKMWKLHSRDQNSIGQTGYSILDEELVAKLFNKYKTFAQCETLDISKRVLEMLTPSQERADLTGTALWRFDKKMALEIMLIAHHQQLLHPALIRKIEENYPMVYARSFSLIRQSEVEILIYDVKINLITLLWQDAANDIAFLPSQTHGVN